MKHYDSSKNISKKNCIHCRKYKYTFETTETWTDISTNKYLQLHKILLVNIKNYIEAKDWELHLIQNINDISTNKNVQLHKLYQSDKTENYNSWTNYCKHLKITHSKFD